MERNLSKRIDYDKYITRLDTKSKGFNGWMFRDGRCGLCGGIFKLAGIRGHIYYAHFYERE